jgi:cytochrome P450
MTAAQHVPPALADQIRALRSQATPATVPGGILLWWGAGEPPDGTGSVPALDRDGFEGNYLRVENGSLAPEAVPLLGLALAATAVFRPDGELPIAIARFRYAVPRPELVGRVRRAAEEGRGLRHPPRTLDGELEQRQAFFACGLLHDQWGLAQPVYRGRTVPFVVLEEFHITNPGEPLPDAIELDPGDGGGFRAVEIGQRVLAEYPDSDSAAVTIRCRYGSETLSARFTVALSDSPAAPQPDEIWPLRARDGGNTGTAYIYLANGATAVHNPLIMVEGFPGGHPPDYLYDTLDQHGTATGWRAAGYDLVIVGLDNGMDEIQRNADVLGACIRETISRTDAPLVVGGMSMGGLVSRFALTAMEARGEPHHTSIFLTIDTPHRGTYTSLGAQWFVHAMKGCLPSLTGYARLLDSPANQQFDLWWVHDGVAQCSPLREAFVTELAALGDYPKLPRRLAAACGRGDGARGIPPGAQVLRWAGEPWISAELRTLADGASETIGQGSWFLAEPERLAPLIFGGDVAWDGAPGALEPYNGQVATLAGGARCGAVAHEFDSTCTVPTVSALDLPIDPFSPVPPPAAGRSPFDDYAFCAENQQHLTITPELSTWLLTALGTPPPTRQATSMADGWNPDQFNPHDPAFLADPYPTYARFREQAPIHRVEVYKSDWMFRYPDCEQVLTGTDTWLKKPPQGFPAGYGPPGVMSNFPVGLFSSDPPLHTQLRSILEPMFDQAIQSAPQLAAKFAGPALATARQHGRIELINDYALPVPSSVLFELLGIPDDPGVWSGLITWQAAIAAAHDITQSAGVRGTGATCSMALNSFFEGLLLANRAKPATGLFAQICDAFASTGLSPQEVQMCAVDFLVAGYLSTTFIIGTGVRNLLLNPDQLTALRENPSLIGGALEEMLRIDGPVQVIDRYAATDTEVGGRQFAPGAKVTAVVGSADHDPSVFNDPDSFLIERAGEAHMGFGAGTHYCIGAPLVRLVAPVAIEMLLAEFPQLALDGVPQWQTDPYLRAVTSLPLRF